MMLCQSIRLASEIRNQKTPHSEKPRSFTARNDVARPAQKLEPGGLVTAHQIIQVPNARIGAQGRYPLRPEHVVWVIRAQDSEFPSEEYEARITLTGWVIYETTETTTSTVTTQKIYLSHKWMNKRIFTSQHLQVMQDQPPQIEVDLDINVLREHPSELPNAGMTKPGFIHYVDRSSKEKVSINLHQGQNYLEDEGGSEEDEG
ncbi:MAG: hypothetical protein AAGC60_16365 [Acidobacteriota bacterium]